MQDTSDPPGDGGLLAELLGRLPGDWTDRLDRLRALETPELGWLGEESARVGANLLLLLQRSGPEILALGGRVTLFALIGALTAALVATLFAGLLHLIVIRPLLRRGWRTGRLVGCLAVTFLLLGSAFGGGWAGLWLGTGHALESAIEDHYVLERTAAATFLAFTLESEELPGRGADPAEIERLLGRAQRRSATAWEAFRTRARVAGESGDLDRQGWLRPELLAAVVQRLGGGESPDLAALHRVLTSPPAEAGAEPLPRTAGLRARAVGLLRAHVYAQAATSAGLGIGLPFALLLVVALLGLPLGRQRRESPSHRGGAA